MTDNDSKKLAFIETDNLNDNADGEAPGLFEAIFAYNFNFLDPKPRKPMPKNVPEDIKRDVFGFLSRKENNKNLFICKDWCSIIERGGKGLDQLQIIWVGIRYLCITPLLMEFNNGEKLIYIWDGHEIDGPLVLKNSILEEVSVRIGYDAFVQFFQKITKFLGQKVPAMRFLYEAHKERPFHDLLQFRENYSGTNLKTHLKYSIFRLRFFL